MDIKINKTNSGRQIWAKALIVLLAFIFASYWVFSQPQASHKVDASQIWFDRVKQGRLALEVTGFGLLESKVQRFLTAPFSAVIEEIVLKPGANVTPDSVLLKLSNPDIDQAVIMAQLAFNEQMARLKQLRLTLVREKLVAENELAELKLDLGVVHAKLAAETKLARDGIVTQLTLMMTQAQVDKLSGRLDNATKQLAQLSDLHQQREQIQQEQINEKRSLLTLAKDRAQRLEVKAGMTGVLQALPVQLGQSVSIGSQLALVGGTDDLLAVIQIPQRDVQGVTAGMAASIDTRGGVARGKVLRINPVVNDGNVAVEISLMGSLPENARPSLNVEAKITLGMLDNALYMQAPVNGVEHSRLQVYKHNEDSNTAQLTWLEFGARSGQFIEIRSGAKPGEQFILSDMREHAEKQQITLIQ